MIERSVHSLTFGDLVWVEAGANPPDDSGIIYRVQAQDATFGTAVPVTVALLWLGRAGAPVSWDSTPNREPVFRITVEADDSDLLARGEKALQLQCEQPTTLAWTPPDGAGEPSVFDIVWSHLEPIFDRDGLTGVGMEEAVIRTRTYVVRMQALPYARGVDLVVTPAAVGTATETVIDDGTSAVGWQDGLGGTPTVVSGALQSTHFQLLKTAGLGSLTAGRYLTVTWQATYSPSGLTMQLNSSPTQYGSPIATVVSGGWTTTYFTIPAGVTTSNFFAFYANPNGATGTLSIDKIAMWTDVPFFGSARQKAMSLVPGGSVRTQGSIHVSHASSALGQTIVYTYPAGIGYLPPLRPWRVQSQSVTTDAAMLSGARNLLGPTSTEYQMPASAAPVGRVEVWARIRATLATGLADITWKVASQIGGTSLPYEVRTTAYNFAVLNTWYLVNLGASYSPPNQVGPAWFVRVGIQDLASGSKGLEVDEAYMFATDSGSLTVLDCGTGAAAAGGPSRHLRIDAPTPEVPMGAIFRGHSEDRSDDFHAGEYAQTWGTHDFDPTGTAVFVVTGDATDAVTSLEHYRRYNTFVSRED